MICFECAKTNDTVAAVAICQHCGVGLCFDHLIEETHSVIGGTHEGCRHEVPQVSPLVEGPANIAVSARRHTAGVV